MPKPATRTKKRTPVARSGKTVPASFTPDEISEWDVKELRRIVKTALNEYDPVRYMKYLMAVHPQSFTALAVKVLPGQQPVDSKKPDEPMKVVFVFEEGKGPKTIDVTPSRAALPQRAGRPEGAKV